MCTHVCEFCNKTFSSKKKTQRFCSHECANKASKNINRNSSTKIEVICAQCGKHEFVSPSRAKKYICCSKKCLGEYNKIKYSKKLILTCPICGKTYECKQSKISHHRTCGNPSCRSKWLSLSRYGTQNANYKKVVDLLKNPTRHKELYYHIVKEHFNFSSLAKLKDAFKGYDIHHKNCDHTDNRKENLVILPHEVHMLLHRYFGNILLNALHSERISLNIFKQICTQEQWNFYKDIYELNIMRQVVVKQGELLENPEEDNQQLSIYRNIYESSTTNSRGLTDNAEVSNANTSALPVNSGDDIV